MKTFRIVRTIALGALISLAAATSASAQRGAGQGNRQGSGQGMRQGTGQGMNYYGSCAQRADQLKIILDLTPEQEAKVIELGKKHAAEAEAHRAQMDSNRQVRRDTHLAEMKAILTPEQFAKFEALRDERGNQRRR